MLIQCTKCFNQWEVNDNYIGHAICPCGYAAEPIQPSTVEDLVDLLNSKMFAAHPGTFAVTVRPIEAGKQRYGLKYNGLRLYSSDDLNDLFKQFLLASELKPSQQQATPNPGREGSC